MTNLALVRLRRQATTSLAARGEIDFATRSPPSLPIDGRAEDPLKFVKDFVAQVTESPGGGRVLFAAESTGRRETLLESFRRHGIQPAACANWREFAAGHDPIAITIAPVDRGLVLAGTAARPQIAVVAEPQLFGERARQRRRRRRATRDAESIVRDLSELNVGAPVVHEDHGVGRYLGLESLNIGSITNEFLCIEYAGGDKLYVPGRLAAPGWPLHRRRCRARAAAQARHVAVAKGQAQGRGARLRRGRRAAGDPGAAGSAPGPRLRDRRAQLAHFEQAFPFEDHADQQNAIDAVLDDMAKPAPMDRLVCGDVGFGKTEVAMRAAFVAVQAGKQVAVLVPTTLLAQQHHQTFSDRFADWPVRIGAAFALSSAKERDASC